MKFLFLGFFYLGCLLPVAYTQMDNPLIGTWQGKNDLGHEVRVEFSQDGYYLLSVDGTFLINRIGGNDPVRYQITGKSSPHMKITLYDGPDRSDCGSLQVAFPTEDQLELAPVLQDDKPDLSSVILLRKLHVVD